MTAKGRVWNASIVSEIVAWGQTAIAATGFGAYIAAVTAVGEWPRIALGIDMMSLYVVGLNRLVWRRLYQLAETKFQYIALLGDFAFS